MKRRIAFTLAAIMATTMLSACGGNTPSETQPQTSGNDSGTSAVTSENSTSSSADTTSSAPDATTSAATSETTTAAPEEPVVPEELPIITSEPVKISNQYIVNGGIAFKSDGKNYVYNITDNEIYETEYDVSELAVIKGCMAVFGYVSPIDFDDTDAFIVNLKTGEKYDDIKPIYNYWDCGHSGSYITVGKVEKGFSDITTSIGMLNDNGEWVMPLSSDYAVCDFNEIFTGVYQNDEAISFSDGSTKYLYDVANDKMVDVADGFNIWSIYDDVIITSYTSNGLYLYKYDISTNENTLINDNGTFDGLTGSNWFVCKDGIYKIYDKSLNFIQKYNLSEYSDAKVKTANEKLVVFVAKGADGEWYTLMQTNDGKLICDPILGGGGALIFGDKVALNAGIVDINTGEITEYSANFSIRNVDYTNSLLLVESDGAYYLVDPENPDVLINPFERASN